jgi:hypothetical protein
MRQYAIRSGAFSDEAIRRLILIAARYTEDRCGQFASATEEGEILNVFRLEPVARPNDYRWDNAPPVGKIAVAARTAGDARIVAEATSMIFSMLLRCPAKMYDTTRQRGSR